MNLNQIIADGSPRNYHGAFVLIKPTQPFFAVGNDYQILSFPDNQIICKARLIEKKTYRLNEIPEKDALLFKDIPLKNLQRIFMENSKALEYDVMLFSSNSHYNDWYKERTRPKI